MTSGCAGGMLVGSNGGGLVDRAVRADADALRCVANRPLTLRPVDSGIHESSSALSRGAAGAAWPSSRATIWSPWNRPFSMKILFAS